jgi:hypothetical protein
MEKKRNTELVSVRMPKDLKTLVEDEALERVVSISTVIRWALYNRYQTHPKRDQKSLKIVDVDGAIFHNTSRPR